MVALTRTASRTVRDLLISTFLDLEGDNTFTTTLEKAGIYELEDLISMEERDIVDLVGAKKDANDITTTFALPRGSKRKILLLIKWITMKKQDKGTDMELSDWNSLSADEFNDYRTKIDPFSPILSLSKPDSSSSNSKSSTDKNKADLELFKRTIKRDASIYPTLRDDKDWDSWNRGMQSLARAQDLVEVLDPKYVPVDDISIELFNQKQSFMYSVLNRVVLTDTGKTVVRKYEHTYDAQSVYSDLVVYAKHSAAANINIETLTQQLTTIRLDSRWSGSTKGFILNWRDKMRIYEELTPVDEHYKDGAKKRMLGAAVQNVEELRAIKLQDLYNKSLTGNTLGYQDYTELLLSAATERDAQLKIPPQRNRRNINVANTNVNDIDISTLVDNNIDYDYDYDYTDINDNIDVSDINLDVNVTNRQFIPGNIWNLLPQEAKDYFVKGNANDRKPNNAIKKYNAQSNLKRTNFVPNNQTRTASLHELEEQVNEDFYECNEPNMSSNLQSNSYSPDNIQVNVSEKERMHPGDVCNVVTSASKQGNRPNMQMKASKDCIELNGKKYYASNTIITYSTFNHHVSSKTGSLIDRGANGGVAGSDVLVIETTHRTCDVTGINNHTIKSLPIVTCAGLVKSSDGPVIVILHQYAYTGKANTIHSSAQIEYFGNKVDDRSLKVEGKQQITTLDNHTLSLRIRNGLAYLDMTKPTQYEYENLEHVVLTSDIDWDPSMLDNEGEELQDANITIKQSLYQTTSFVDYVDDIVDIIVVNAHNVNVNTPDFELLRPNFGYAPVNIVQKTFESTTQWARMSERYPFRKHFKSRFPALNVPRRNEAVATDTIFGDVPALGNGCFLAQIFVGCSTKVTDVYIMKQQSDFVSTLQDNIRHRGAMSALVSDYANVEISNKVKDVLRHFCIYEWQSEPYHQHQNPAERRYQTVKRYVNNILDKTGAPPSTWFLCLKYVCYVLNLTYIDKLNTVPLQKLTGQTQDISILLPFTFYEPVYYAIGDALAYNASVSFPSTSSEAKGWFVGFGESVGDTLTFLVLTKDTNKLLYRSSVRSAITSPPNLRLETLEGEKDDIDNDDTDSSVAQTNLDSNVNTSFYENLNVPTIRMQETDVDSDNVDVIKDYNNALDHFNRDDDEDKGNDNKLWQFNRIVNHVGPLNTNNKSYKGSNYNLLIEWGDGSQSYEPLNQVAADDPVSCAVYAREKDLLNVPGWKRFRNLSKEEYRMKRMLNINKQAFKPNLPKHKFGFQVPRSVNEASKLDLQLGQTKWADAIRTELDQIHNYETFKNLGKGAPAPEGYKRIRVHFVFDIKHDGRHKARLVAGGHLTDKPDNSVYSSVVSLRDLRLVVFAGEQNSLDIWAADVGNAYLESYTKEKVYIVAGPEFNDLEGCTLVINKALYGLRSSGLRWHERFADTLRDLGFKTCKASVDVWMRPAKTYYEYIAVYVDDLAIVAMHPKTITDTLINKYGYKLKGVGPIDYHLGGNFARDSDGTLRYGPRKYIDKLVLSYTKLFGCPPTERNSPLISGDHPELDDSPELDEQGIKQYQSMIGALQWTTTLGRFDILAAVMTMSRFRVAPRQGHIDRLKRIYGYLKKFNHGAIRFRTNLPDYSMLETKSYDWTSTVYNIEDQEEDNDMPVALGHPVITTTYVDANLMHCLTTGRASTGILHLVNGTTIDWYSKRQSTVQSATYGSEFVAARIATDQIIDLRLTLSYLGIKVIKSIMFGDNKSVVTSATIPQSKLNKRHVALSYHRVREAIANKTLEFYHIDGIINPADMLSKFAGNQQFWPILKPLLFWGVKYEEVEKKEIKKTKEDNQVI